MLKIKFDLTIDIVDRKIIDVVTRLLSRSPGEFAPFFYISPYAILYAIYDF